ncbi:NADH:flavin oxidoreductase [Sporomusa silvacetica]|uniref:NADH:flavin oxidoreductase n=1 Tax=Sporomusa silvacetica TaxID=55504 RepID=UPI000B99EB9B|nr:NADH:flavin oxidoreductase [Sporomusa silvacetica]
MKKLFEHSSIKDMQLKNRFFRAAVWEKLATEDGHLTSELSRQYEELAKGNVGTIITGYAYITKDEQPNPCMMGIYSDDFISEYKILTDTVHRYGANIIMQIVYGGSMTQLNPPSENILGPSAVKNELTGITPIAMTKKDISYIVKAFANAARRSKEAGFDGVELHAAHGYLLSQFLSPHYNQRADEYGGSLENRARILLEVVQAVRAEVGERFPIIAKLNSEDFMEDGITQRESIVVAKLMEQNGLDAVDVSGGNPSDPNVIKNNLTPSRSKIILKKQQSYFKEYAQKLATEISIPVILTGGNRSYDVMENILNTTNIAYFGLARLLISEPNLIGIWTAGDLKTPKCVSCNRCHSTSGSRCILA